MRRMLAGQSLVTKLTHALIIASLILWVGLWYITPVNGAPLVNKSLTLSNNGPGEIAEYDISFDIQTADNLGSIKIEFCSNTALFEDSCIAPTGFDVSNAVLQFQDGETGFAVYAPGTTDNIVVLSRIPAMSTIGSARYTFGNVQNMSIQGSSFLRISTFQTADASGPDTDRGSAVYAINDLLNVSTEVPPILTVCLGVVIASVDCSDVQGDYVNMGEYTTASASTGQTQIVAATNAQNGYTIRVSGATITSGNNALPVLTNPTPSLPGVSQFGMNLRANTDPQSGQEPSGPGSGSIAAGYNFQNQFKYSSGDIVAGDNAVDDYRKYTVTYLVNISSSQPPGIYSSTFTYTALGNF